MSGFTITALRSAVMVPDLAVVERFHTAVWGLRVAACAPGGHWFRGTGSDHHLLALDRVTDTYPGPRAMAVDHEIMRLFDKIGVAEALPPSTAPFPAPDQFGVDG